MSRRTLHKAGVCGLICALWVLSGCDELTARRSVQQGNDEYKNGRYEKAIEEFESALELAPHLDTAHHNAALAYHKLFQPGVETPENRDFANKAVAHFEAYLGMTKDGAEYTRKIVKTMIKTSVDAGNYDQAVAWWQKVLDAKPNDGEALHELAKISEQAKRFDDALKYHNMRAAAATDDAEKFNALFAIGNLQYRRLLAGKEIVGLERVALADNGIEAINKAMQIDPNNEMTRSMLDVLYFQRALAHEVSWARTVELTSALKFRIQWKELYDKKNKQAQQAQQGPSTDG